ncbi:SdpA family antimicrobial peptide system protein [Maribacter luteus]|uniref:SdpA family antimicrobial peptide system protein n=1 Tax=Maribacter luteus TaxID=2594478 RepID=UPI00248F6C63|nr:SdpA family antimicrobial peptide system protein [Maribacter luteus]
MPVVKVKHQLLIIFGFWSIVLYNIFVSAIPVPTNEPYLKKGSFFSLLPQGWGFFTRDPRENQLIVYRTSSNDTIVKVTEALGNYKNFFGMSRKGRLRGIELGILTAKINDSSWIEMKGGQNLLFEKSITADTIINEFRPYGFEGEYFFVKQERIPWAWAESYEKIIMPYKYVKIYVKTNN